MSKAVTAAYSGNVCLPLVGGRVYDDDSGEEQVAGYVDLRAGSVEQSPLRVGQWVTVLTGEPEARYEGHAASRYLSDEGGGAALLGIAKGGGRGMSFKPGDRVRLTANARRTWGELDWADKHGCDVVGTHVSGTVARMHEAMFFVEVEWHYAGAPSAWVTGEDIQKEAAP